MAYGPPSMIWFAWVSFVGPFFLISTVVLLMWFEDKIRQVRATRAIARDFPRMRTVVREALARDPFGRRL